MNTLNLPKPETSNESIQFPIKLKNLYLSSISREFFFSLLTCCSFTLVIVDWWLAPSFTPQGGRKGGRSGFYSSRGPFPINFHDGLFVFHLPGKYRQPGRGTQHRHRELLFIVRQNIYRVPPAKKKKNWKLEKSRTFSGRYGNSCLVTIFFYFHLNYSPSCDLLTNLRQPPLLS